MGMMDKFLNAMRLNDEEEDDFYDEEEEFYDEDDYADEKPKHSFKFGGMKKDNAEPKRSFAKEEPVQEDRQPSSKVTSIRNRRSSQSQSAQHTSSMAVCVIKPHSVEDAREITETLLKGRTVVLNLEGIDLEIGQRLIDFTSGSCYAIDGNLQKISNYIFIVTPSNVDISGDFLNIVDAFGGSSLQTDI